MADHDFIDKKALSERDICTKFITTAMKEVAGWNITQFYSDTKAYRFSQNIDRVSYGYLVAGFRYADCLNSIGRMFFCDAVMEIPIVPLHIKLWCVAMYFFCGKP